MSISDADRLRAGLDEDEQAAQDLLDNPPSFGDYELIARRMLAEVAAGRRILDLYEETAAIAAKPHGWRTGGRDYLDAQRELAVLKFVIAALAGVYEEAEETARD